MEFKNTPQPWNNIGVKPTEALIDEGFKAGYKPPAAYFNYLFNNYYKCIDELQKIIIEQLNKGKVKIGPIDTKLDKGDTLFVVEGMLPAPTEFEAAAFENMAFGPSPPISGGYWADIENHIPIQGRGENPQITRGKLAVSTEQDAPDDTAFLAKIDIQKEREENKNGK